MNPRHPYPCASLGETRDALRRIANLSAEMRNEAERVITGAHDGACDLHQLLWASDLGREVSAIAGVLGVVETAKADALSRIVSLAREVA